MDDGVADTPVDDGVADTPVDDGVADTPFDDAAGSTADPDRADTVEEDPDTPDDADAEVASGEDTAEPSASAAERRGVGKWFERHRRAVIVTTAASFVAAGAFAGAALEPYMSDRATVATKLAVAETAAKAITALWSYTPEDMDTLSDRSAKYLGGGFEEQYRTYVDAIAATNKQAKVTSSTQVVGAAVESLRGAPMADEATAIVYTNTTSTTPQSNNIPSLKYLSYRLELKREGRDWRVTKMTTVTSLDLTPKLGF